jgi:hypothetical protein
MGLCPTIFGTDRYGGITAYLWIALSTAVLHPRPRSPCSARSFVAAKIFIPAGLRAERPASPATSPPVPTNGPEACAINARSGAPSARTAAFFPLPTKSSVGIFPAGTARVAALSWVCGVGYGKGQGVMIPETFVGVDLTDYYARSPRPIDVAILDNASGTVGYKSMDWPPRGNAAMLKLSARLKEFLRGPTVFVIDGPQALAEPQNRTRDVERCLGTPAHTPWKMPEPGAFPFAGYVSGSVEFFAGLVAQNDPVFILADLDGVVPGKATLFEAYPGAAWKALCAGALESKKKGQGRDQRATLLREMGLHLPLGNPTHDQLDAALCAFLAWRFFAPDSNCRVMMFGSTPVYRDKNGVLREGRMLHPMSPEAKGTAKPLPVKPAGG